MEEATRIGALEAALAELTRQQRDSTARLQHTEAAFRRWRCGVIATAALGCVVLPQFVSSTYATDLAAPVAKRLRTLERAVFGVSPVPAGTVDKITNLNTALTAETGARGAADTTLGANLTAEIAAR